MSVPNATELDAIVAVKVAFPSSVRVTEPLKSPERVMVGDLFIVVPDEISPPFISTLLRTGEVSVLLVSVCDPVSVATVLSIAKVTVLLLQPVSYTHQTLPTICSV